MRSRRGLTVVKLGGSFAYSSQLKDWLGALAGCGGRVVVVPGGGPFADTVRVAQPQMGLDDRTAHQMALLAMDQYGCAIVSLGAGLRIAASLAAIRRLLREGAVPVWSPTAMVPGAGDVSPSWDVTSDSLAAWLAGKLAAGRLLLVKQVGPTGTSVSVNDLVARGVVDPAFPRFLAASGATASLAGPAEYATAAAAIRSGSAAGTRITAD
jgi:5-(aminomethyl)-3-furanmethanol phosphate kinase